MDTFIEFKAGSNNLLGTHTKSFQLYQFDMSSKLDSFCWSIGLFSSYVHQGLYCKMNKWKKSINLDEHSKIMDRFLIFSQILLGICLIACVITSFFLRGVLVYRISKRIFGLLPL